jgi:predicted Rossmann fold flavoprotein
MVDMAHITCDVLVLGAGAAGLMCALTAGQRGKSVIVLDHAKNPAEKIRISGGGRCNFTNIHSSPAHFLSNNPRFAISALKSYAPADFIKLVEAHRIPYHTKTLGQLFCDHSAGDIIAMLLDECAKGGVKIHLQTSIEQVSKTENGFLVTTPTNDYHASALVVATGGLSIPKMGATGLGYRIAEQFGLPITPTRAGLVPFTLQGDWLERAASISGVSVADANASLGKTHFREAMLFTHRGLSGPAILQLSSYWQEGQPITLNLAPELDVFAHLKQQKLEHPKQDIATTLNHILPKRLAQTLHELSGINGTLADLSHAKLQQVSALINTLTLTPSGTEGYRTAEVTLGGVDTNAVSSKTMQATSVHGLYFIGEVLDVTGHLGGHNFQWAWASGVAAGRAAGSQTISS